MNGWRTSEMTFGALAGTAIVEIAHGGAATLPEAVVRGCACLALAWIAARYTMARTEAKHGQRRKEGF